MDLRGNGIGIADASIEDSFEEFCCIRRQSYIAVVIRCEMKRDVEMKEIKNNMAACHWK